MGGGEGCQKKDARRRQRIDFKGQEENQPNMTQKSREESVSLFQHAEFQRFCVPTNIEAIVFFSRCCSLISWRNLGS